MVAELSSMMPSNHGYIVWVYRGLGEFIGYINGWNQMVSTGFDVVLYPVLMSEYIDQLYKKYNIKLFFFFMSLFINAPIFISEIIKK